MYTLVIDVGNSNITCGIFAEEGNLLTKFRLHTNSAKTEDEYYAAVRSLVEERIPTPSIETAVLSSVVPSLTAVMEEVCRRLTHRPPVLLGPALYPYLPISVLSPHEIGSDLVANALEAFLRCRQSCVVVDFGTALSFTALRSFAATEEQASTAPTNPTRPGRPGHGQAGTEAKIPGTEIDDKSGRDPLSVLGEIAGVAIAPGIGSAVKALSRDAAQLFQVELTVPSTVLGKNTVHAIQSGVLHGYMGLVSHLVSRMKAELEGPVRVFATGGYSRLFEQTEGLFDERDPNLTLYGLYRVTKIPPIRLFRDRPLQ